MKHPAQAKYFIKITLPAILISFFFVALAQIVFAQEAPQRSITISPPTIEHTLIPGERAEGVLKVTNGGNTDLTFQANIHDFIVEDKIGTPNLLADETLTEKYSAATWLAVTPNSFTVPAGTTKELSYFLQVPADAAPGGRYAAVVYEPVNILDVEGTGAGVNTQSLSLFYITIDGPITEDAEVVNFSIPGFSEYPPVTVSTEIKNNGPLHIKPSGSIIIRNMFGKEIARHEFTGGNIFPEATLLYENEFFSDSKIRVGRYTAELSTAFGRDLNIPLEATASFIIFPWKIAAGIALLIAILVVTVVLIRNKKTPKNPRPEATPQPTIK